MTEGSSTSSSSAAGAHLEQQALKPFKVRSYSLVGCLFCASLGLAAPAACSTGSTADSAAARQHFCSETQPCVSGLTCWSICCHLCLQHAAVAQLCYFVLGTGLLTGWNAFLTGEGEGSSSLREHEQVHHCSQNWQLPRWMHSVRNSAVTSG